MGYQEAYVTTKNQNDFSKLVDYIKNLGKGYFDSLMSEPVEVITLNQEIKGDYAMMCKPEKQYNFNKDDRFIYFVGERHPLRCVENLLGRKALREKFDTEIIFTECFPSEKIFSGDDFAKHEEFSF